jgi:excisionase family DNA binding protein
VKGIIFLRLKLVLIIWKRKVIDKIEEKIEDKTYLTPSEVSDLLMMSSAAIRRWASNGELKAFTTPGGHRRFLPEDVEAFAQSKNIKINDLSMKFLKVLVVDDDMQFSKYLMKMLAKYPEQVVVDKADNGFDAGIKINAFKPDVVLLDLMMSGMDGFQVCKSLKSDLKTRDIRVIAMTGYPSASNIKNIVEAGAEVCLPKPINRSELLDLLGITRD